VHLLWSSVDCSVGLTAGHREAFDRTDCEVIPLLEQIHSPFHDLRLGTFHARDGTGAQAVTGAAMNAARRLVWREARQAAGQNCSEAEIDPDHVLSSAGKQWTSLLYFDTVQN
jgi:hypothetical protein